MGPRAAVGIDVDHVEAKIDHGFDVPARVEDQPAGGRLQVHPKDVAGILSPETAPEDALALATIQHAHRLSTAVIAVEEVPA